MRIQREEFVKSLAAVEAGLSAKDVIEQSSCYVFRGGRVWTFNDEVACSMPSPVGDVECAVPAEKLRAVVERWKDETIDLSLTDGELILRTKSERIGVRTEAEISLPLGEIAEAEKWSKIPKGFGEAVESVEQVAGRDESLFIMTCVHLTPNGLEASDNAQAIRYRLKTGLVDGVLLKRNSLVRIAKLDAEEWSVGESWMHFRNSSGLTASCRRVVEEYPSKLMTEVLKVTGKEASLPKGLVEATRMAALFVDSKRDAHGLSVDLNSSRLLVRVEGVMAWYERRYKTEYEGERLSFRIAPKLLQEVCERSSSCTVGTDKLMVKGESFVYVTCLEKDEDD